MNWFWEKLNLEVRLAFGCNFHVGVLLRQSSHDVSPVLTVLLGGTELLNNSTMSERQDESMILNVSLLAGAAHAQDAAPQKRGRGRPRKPTVTDEPTFKGEALFRVTGQ